MAKTLLMPPSPRNIERVFAWGRAQSQLAYVYRPTNVDELKEVFKVANDQGLSIALRGTGCSYGDASLNQNNVVLDLTRYNKILAWDPNTGVATVEPGVTVQQLWQHCLPDGYWPPVVSGTMYPTLGGIAAMNIHGKNNFKVGPIGNHIQEFEILLPTGKLEVCSREKNAKLFHAAIGGFGTLGIFTKITLKMKKIYSGYVWVEALTAGNFEEMFHLFQQRLPQSDYLVGWVDCLAPAPHLGRGVIHQANYLKEGEDSHPEESMRVANQHLPDKIMGVFPAGLLYLCMAPFVNNMGMRMINAAKYWSARFSLRGHKYLQPHAAFNFLLDYVPNWKLSYGAGGLIQYQSFIPKERAQETLKAQIRLGQEFGLPSYLGVLKRHQPDPFLMTHAVDGWSMALDFKVTEFNREKLWQLAHEMDRLVVSAGGKFYFAKDSTLERESVLAAFGEDKIAQFTQIKMECDPKNLLQTNLSRRLFEFGPVKRDAAQKMPERGVKGS